ncbi:MAG: hypothetical protein ACOC2U_01770 [bacterium]
MPKNTKNSSCWIVILASVVCSLISYILLVKTEFVDIAETLVGVVLFFFVNIVIGGFLAILAFNLEKDSTERIDKRIFKNESGK